MYLGNQRRRSTLGRRFRNGERPADKAPPCPPVFPTITPRTGLGRSRAATNLKASDEYAVRKRLFLKSPKFNLHSSGKKSREENLSKVAYNSPNDSQGSFKSDSSLNLTGVRSITDPSPDYRSGSASSSFAGKAYQEYRRTAPAIRITSPASVEKLKMSPLEKYNPMEPPKSPGFSHYERLMRIERAKIKQPVDPDDLEVMKYLSIDESLNFNPDQELKTSTAIKKPTLPNEFSTFVPSKYTGSEFKFSSTSEPKASESMGSTFNPQNVTTASSFLEKYQTSDFQNKMKSLEEKNTSLFKCSSESTSNHNSSKLFFDTIPKSEVFGEKPSIFSKNLQSADYNFKSWVKSTNTDSNHTLETGTNQKLCQNESFVSGLAAKVEKEKDQLISSESTFSLNSKTKDDSITNLNKVVRPTVKEMGDKFNTTKTDLDINISNQENHLTLSSAKKLSTINERDEKELLDIEEDLDSTDSFIMAENTMVDQEETIIESQNKSKDEKHIANGIKIKSNLGEGDLSDYDEELVEAMEKFDGLKKDMNNLKVSMLKMLRDMEKVQREMTSCVPNLHNLIAKRTKLKQGENKENVPATLTKQQIKSKVFNELKSNNPNLLKTPNPERRSVSRASLASQAIMTPHSLSVVISDQLDDLYD